MAILFFVTVFWAYHRYGLLWFLNVFVIPKGPPAYPEAKERLYRFHDGSMFLLCLGFLLATLWAPGEHLAIRICFLIAGIALLTWEFRSNSLIHQEARRLKKEVD